MKIRSNIIIVFFVQIVTLIIMSISSCTSKSAENDKKAALYDESLSKTYLFLSEVHQSLYVVINTYEKAAFEAKDDYSLDFKESLENNFLNLVDNERTANEAWKIVEYDESFISTAVCSFMCKDGGPAREEQALAFRKFTAIWFELCSPPRLEYDSYDSLMERLNLFRKTLSESMPVIVKHMKSYDKDKYGWRKYTPYRIE